MNLNNIHGLFLSTLAKDNKKYLFLKRTFPETVNGKEPIFYIEGDNLIYYYENKNGKILLMKDWKGKIICIDDDKYEIEEFEQLESYFKFQQRLTHPQDLPSHYKLMCTKHRFSYNPNDPCFNIFYP